MGKQPNDFGFVEETQTVLAPQEEPKKETFGFVEESRAVLKKKESTTAAVSSEKPSPEVGSEELPKPSEQDGKPTEKATGSIQPPVLEYLVDPLIAAAKQIYSGLADQTPKNIAQGIEVLKSGLQSGNVEDFIRQKKAIEFQKYVRGKEKQLYLDTTGLEEKDVLKWYQPFDIEKYLPQYKESFIKDKGYQEMKKKIEANLPEVIKRRLDTEQYVQEQNKEAAETLKGVPQSYRDIKTPKQAIEYAFNMGAQGLWQIPLTVISKGMSGEIMEAATVYDQQLDQLAEKHKISREEVIKRNLDKPAAGQLYAIAAAGLDLASAGGVVNIAKKGGSSLLQKTLAATTEVITEPTQGTLEEMGGAKGAGKSQVKAFEKAWSANLSKRIDEGLGALFGTQAINAVGAIKSVPETIVEAKETIKSSGDINAADQAAATIIEKVKSTPEEGVTNDSSIGQREVQGEVGKGQEPIKATEQGGGPQEIGGDRVFQNAPSSGQTQEVNETPKTGETKGTGATTVSETPPQETLPPQEQLQSTVTEQTVKETVKSAALQTQDEFLKESIKNDAGEELSETSKKRLHRNMVHDKLPGGVDEESLYTDLIKQGKITVEQVKDIIESAGLKVPREILQVKPPIPEATAGAEPTVSTNAEETKGRQEGETLLTSEGSKGEGLPTQPSPASGKPKATLEYITDEKVLKRPIKDTVTDEDGNIEPRDTTVGKKQADIKKRMKQLESLMDCLHG